MAVLSFKTIKKCNKVCVVCVSERLHGAKTHAETRAKFFLHQTVISLLSQNLCDVKFLHETLIRHFGGLSQFDAKKNLHEFLHVFLLHVTAR